MLSGKMRQFKIFVLAGGLVCFIVAFLFALYLWIIPHLVASHRLHQFIDAKMYESMGVNLVSKNVELKTGFPIITFKADLFKLTQKDKDILVLENIDTEFSITKLFKKKIIVNKLGADYIFADVNKIVSLIPEQKEKEEVKTDWYVDFMNSYLYLKQLKVLYTVNDVGFDIDTKSIVIDNSQKEKKFVHFDIKGQMTQGKNKVKVLFKDENKVYIKDNHLIIDESVISFNKSKLHIKGNIVDDKKYEVNVFAKDFGISNIVSLIKSDLVIKNGSEMLSYFDNIEGGFDFNIALAPKGLNGNINLHHLCFILIPIENVPVHIHSGNIAIDTKLIL